MAEEAFNKDGTLKEPGSGVSRYCGTTTLENAWLT
jgi:hypothetical protein